MSNAFRELFGRDVRSPFERALLGVCATSGFLFLSFWSLPDVWSRLLPEAISGWVFGLIILTFGASFTVVSVKAVGRAAGKETFGAQVRLTFGRVFLYLLLPCLLFAIGSVVWMILNGRL